MLDFKNVVQLENERVLLRPLLITDLEYLLPFSLNEPELWTYSLTRGDGRDNLEKYMNLAMKERREEKAYPFIVFDKKSNAYAGSTRFYDYQLTHKTTLIGYTWFGKKFQRTGLNQHCKLLMLEYAFEELGLERVEFRADYRNKRSIVAMKNIGCVEEGVLRSNCASPKGRRDSIILSILKEEWFDEVKEKLIAKAKF